MNGPTTAELVKPGDLIELTPGTIVQNYRGEYGMVTEGNQVLRLTPQQVEELLNGEVH